MLKVNLAGELVDGGSLDTFMLATNLAGGVLPFFVVTLGAVFEARPFLCTHTARALAATQCSAIGSAGHISERCFWYKKPMACARAMPLAGGFTPPPGSRAFKLNMMGSFDPGTPTVSSWRGSRGRL